MGFEQCKTTIKFFTKDWLFMIDFCRHMHILCSLSREHKCNGPFFHLPNGGRNSSRRQKHVQCIVAAATYKHSPPGKSFATNLTGVGNIGEIKFRMLFKE